MSQSCRENGKVGSMEGLCPCFVCIDWSHGPSTGTITDGHRARYGIVVCSLVTALKHKWRLETACCLLTRYILWRRCLLAPYLFRAGGVQRTPGHLFSFLCSRAGSSCPHWPPCLHLLPFPPVPHGSERDPLLHLDHSARCAGLSLPFQGSDDKPLCPGWLLHYKGRHPKDSNPGLWAGSPISAENTRCSWVQM